MNDQVWVQELPELIELTEPQELGAREAEVSLAGIILARSAKLQPQWDCTIAGFAGDKVSPLA